MTTLVILAAYNLLRYAGRWGETDAATFSRAIQVVLDAGRLAPPTEAVYPNGYGYQALAVFSSLVGGQTPSRFQLYLSFLLMPWIVLPAWLLYRQLTGSAPSATLATVILLVQPEFLFPLLRGTHEKFTRGLIFLALFLFVKSLDRRQPLPRAASFILAFYLVIYGVIAFNNLIAISLIVGLLVALALLAVQRWWSRAAGPAPTAAERRLRYAVVAAIVLAFLFTFFFYQPALHDVELIEHVVDQIAALLLDVDRSTAVNPYAYTAAGWVSRPAYLALSMANWLLLFASAAIWLWQSLQLVRRRSQTWPPDSLLLWALYGAFALQGALSVLLDYSGVLSSNLQLRVFPSFAMMAAPLVARALAQRRPLGARSETGVRAVALACLGVIAALSVLKATNEPLVSNKWTFYIPAEMRAVDHARSVLPDRPLWTGFDERLGAARVLRDPAGADEEWLDGGVRKTWTRDIVVSEVILARSGRLSLALPVEGDSLLTYDNGQAQLYHLRPRTPFQR